MGVTERFLNYVKIKSTSSANLPGSSSWAQFRLASYLAEELKTIGVENVKISSESFVYAWLPASIGYADIPAIGFVAHMNTGFDLPSENIKPQIIKNYDGGDVPLGNSGKTLSLEKFPHLSSLKGQTLITTDGTTILGADDKAGIAEIITAIEMIITDDIPHGKICVAFMPDEEIKSGADHFDIEGFGANYAYAIDGRESSEINIESFNAFSAHFSINGLSVYPGDGKGILNNALLIAYEINSLLPGAEIPRNTEGYEGYYHLCEMQGNVGHAEITYAVRDHSNRIIFCRKKTLEKIASLINEKYGLGTVTLNIQDEYENMKEVIKSNFFLVEKAKAAIKAAGMEPVIKPIRGGSNGARLSFLGLPCPNLGVGGYAFHGPYEHITAENMQRSACVVVEVVKQFALDAKKAKSG